MLHSADKEHQELQTPSAGSDVGTQASLKAILRNREKDCPQDSNATAAPELTDLLYPPTLLRYWQRKGEQTSALNTI